MSVPHRQWERLAEIRTTIEARTDLRATDPVFVLGHPGSILHRRFSFALPTSEYADGTAGVQPQPGGVLLVQDTLEVSVSHDLDPGAHDASWRLAADDVGDLIGALLAAPCRAWLRVVGGGSAPTVEGSRIVQRVTLQYRYYLLIPEA